MTMLWQRSTIQNKHHNIVKNLRYVFKYIPILAFLVVSLAKEAKTAKPKVLFRND